MEKGGNASWEAVTSDLLFSTGNIPIIFFGLIIFIAESFLGPCPNGRATPGALGVIRWKAVSEGGIS